MKVTLRKFEERDIENKLRWINDSRNNQFLHYDLPLQYDKTLNWFRSNQGNESRYDAVIEYDGTPCGLAGLLSIDRKNGKAEFYISMDHEAKGRGIATQAGKLLLRYAFETLGLNRVFLYTEKDNVIAQKLFAKIGFMQEGLLRHDLCLHGRLIDRYVYGIDRLTFLRNEGGMFQPTPVHAVTEESGNQIFMKREDLIPFSFGGNKARKAYYFFQDIEKSGCGCIVTYGSSSSNHCRVTANLAAGRGLPTFIISPEESSEPTFNSQMMTLFGAEITVCPVAEVHDTIEAKLAALKEKGMHPYFIPGGGHGNIGTQAFADCYREILDYEQAHRMQFDYIFHASGTGTTQAGLICGKLINHGAHQIVGISIARKNPRGRDVVLESVRDYLAANGISCTDDMIEENTVFTDRYTGGGYGCGNQAVQETISRMLIRHGIPMDETYTGKAYTGMCRYLEENEITGKKILFLHTGGTPLFFDGLGGCRHEN